MKEPKEMPSQFPSKITEIKVDTFPQTEAQEHFNLVSIQEAFFP